MNTSDSVLDTSPGGSPAVDATMPAERTIVHLVRHGEVDNPTGVLYGRLAGFHLSARGQAMADRLATVLGPRDLAAVVASPLERAVETAAPIAASCGLSVDVDERVIEASNVFAGTRLGNGERLRDHLGLLIRLVNPFRPSWGESYVSVAARMLAAAAAVRDRAAGHEAVIVSHQLPIWVARRAVERRQLWHDPRRRQCALASVTSLVYEGHRIVSVAYTEPAFDLLPTVKPKPRP